MITYRRSDEGGPAVLMFAAAAAAAMVTACMTPSPEPEAAATSQLTSLPPGAGVPQRCKWNTYCSFGLTTGSEADTSHYPLWDQLGCGPIYNFRNGTQFGHGAICVDSPDNRALLQGTNVMGLVPVLHCVAPPAISPCLELPVGLIFVDLDPIIMSPSPYCPSSCQETQRMEQF